MSKQKNGEKLNVYFFRKLSKGVYGQHEHLFIFKSKRHFLLPARIATPARNDMSSVSGEQSVAGWSQNFVLKETHSHCTQTSRSAQIGTMEAGRK